MTDNVLLRAQMRRNSGMEVAMSKGRDAEGQKDGAQDEYDPPHSITPVDHAVLSKSFSSCLRVALFLAQGFDRIDQARAARREKTGKQRSGH